MRKPSLGTVISQMKKQGVDIAGCEFKPDGSFKVMVGKPVQMTAEDRNEWDTVQ